MEDYLQSAQRLSAVREVKVKNRFEALTETDDNKETEPESQTEKTPEYDSKVGSALGTARLYELPTASTRGRAQPGSNWRNQTPAQAGYAQIGVRVLKGGQEEYRDEPPGSSGGCGGAGGW